MIAPPFAPEAAGDGAPIKVHRLDVFAFFAQLVHLPPRFGAALGYRYVSPPLPPKCHSAPPYNSARVTSRRTSCSSSSSGNSVRFTSPSLLRMSSANCRFSASSASIRSSMVPLVMNLLTNAKRAVGSLIFHGRVPPAIEVDDVRSGSQIQACPPSSERQDEKRRAV